MGIQGVLKTVLRPAGRQIDLVAEPDFLMGQRLAIDTSGWLHKAILPRETAVHARLGTPLLGSPWAHNPGRCPLAPRATARRTSPAGEIWRLLRRGVAARPRHRVLLCGQLMGCVASVGADGCSRPGQRRTLVGPRGRPSTRLVASNERARRSFSTKGVPRSRTCRYI